jgi:dTDP-4-dehydrorhamnose reductase
MTMRRYFKKNVDQTDLFDLAAQLNEIKQLRSAESELSMIALLGTAELNLIESKKKTGLNWVQVSTDSIFD